jgi:glutamate:Na+ symporter, ESS family
MPLTIEFNALISFTVGVGALLLGKWLNRHLRFLQFLNIPEAVSGGMAAALVFNMISAAGIAKLGFSPAARDLFLVCFFTCLGLRLHFYDLKSGGKLLYIVFISTAGCMLMQNMVGILIALLNGLPAVVGIFSGSMSLIGGHATVVALASAHSRLPACRGPLRSGPPASQPDS